MKSIFDNAKFGDRFVTRDGRTALFIKEVKCDNKTNYYLAVEDVINSCPYLGNGLFNTKFEAPEMDIVKNEG